PSTILVIFGVTGDLSHRYLLPALSQVAAAGQLPKDFKVIGISRRNLKTQELLEDNEAALKKYIEPLQMNLSQLTDYSRLKKYLESSHGKTSLKRQIIFYFAVPPLAVLPIIRLLGQAGLNGEGTKLLLEKPFGTDLESARELIEETARHFKDNQVYRIDHYLAKEMAQNITVFLASNAIFRSIWDNRFVEKIEIDVAEKIGIEGRAAFYEPTGALRDIVQSHLLQLAALTLMEPCSGVFEFSELPARRLAALKSLQPARQDSIVRGQYLGYRTEVSNPRSATETFVSLTVTSADPRWEGVPIRLTTGKNLSERLTEIRIHFKQSDASQANVLTLRVQPREGIELELWVKQPGYERKLQKLPLHFTYEQHFDRVPDAYEQVLFDAMHSNPGLFSSNDEVLATWETLQPIQSRWEMDDKDLQFYKPGSTITEILKTRLPPNGV
ncbi:MAG: glucose-6-phosphate dehydrogenase, partial [Candidatus Saccharimonadales bacterium]